MEKNEKFFGLDVYRILCCLGVLVYHVADDTFVGGGGGVTPFTKSKVLYFFASYCVPGFFVLQGFLFFKNENDIQKVERKIKSVMKKLFGWILFWTFAIYFFGGKLNNVFEQFEFSFVSKGIMPVGWFLFTYCIILIFALPAKTLFQKRGFLCVAITFLLLAKLAFFRKTLFLKTQSLWFEIYFSYFLFGMSISFLSERVLFFKSKIFFAVCIFAFFLSAIFYALKFKNTSMLPHTFYGKWYYSIYLSSGFLLCEKLDVRQEKIKRFFRMLSKNTLTVYMFHLPFLLFLTKKYSVRTAKDVVLVVLILFCTSQVASQLFRRLALLNKLV